MTAPSYVNQYATAFNSTTSPKTAMSAVAINSGDVLVGVVVAESGEYGSPDFTENGSSSFTQRQISPTVNADWVSARASTYVASTNENLTVTVTYPASLYFGGNIIRFSGSDGVGASNIATGSSGSPSVSLTTTQANSAIVVICGDWNAVSGTQTFTNNFSGTPTALTDYPGDLTKYGVAIAYFPDAGGVGSKTVGMSAPTGQKWTIIAIEVKGTAGNSYSHAASGGMTTGGAATLKRTRAQQASGGLTTGGAATLKRTRAQQASGGLTTGGAAGASKSAGNSYAASGGLTTGGAATLKLVKTAVATGGLTTGGTGAQKLSKSVSASGGLTAGGTATLKRTSAQPVSGGLTTGGAGAQKLSKSVSASGGITTGGAATLKRTSAQPVSGGLTTGGAATASKSSPGSNSHTASGGLTTGGVAGLKRTQKSTASGGLTTGGAATLKLVKTAAASGGLTTGGTGTIKRTRAQQASGGLTAGGAAGATLQAGRSHVAMGGLALGGMASLRILSHHIATGGLALGGMATAHALSSVAVLPAGSPAFARATILPKIG